MNKDLLNEKQKRFCEEWMIDMNSTQAAIRAGYSAKTANEQGARLLAHVSVQAYIKELREKLSAKLEITRERVLQEYSRIAFFDIRKLYNVDGGLKQINMLEDDEAAGISSTEVKELIAGDMVIGHTSKVRLWNKKEALDSICRVLGFNAPEKIEHTGDSFLDMLMQTSAQRENQPRKETKPKPKAKKPATKSRRSK